MSGTLSNLHTINRLQRQQEAWLEMARLNRDRQSAEVVRDIVQIAAETLLVSQVGVWLFNEDGDAIHAAAIYRLDEDDYLDDITLNRGDYPIYFDALHTHKSIVAFNAREHESTLEFIESYLVPQNIFSMLDATILVSGKSRGVVCCEHKGEIRHWQNDEVLFASAVADQVAQVLIGSICKEWCCDLVSDGISQPTEAHMFLRIFWLLVVYAAQVQPRGLSSPSGQSAAQCDSSQFQECQEARRAVF